ncbi:hypothetical protein T4D_3457 [Trichinella pseudospiralis]|uniref:Uncharacterized protein n=1 Tax=Trichinella pseudospiralis TaxID=6337 RepID=A0A0V1FTS8_TRIPS|nr:hypothetical protein T4D_3457 [Trichinella pseudospiralis]
MTGKTISCFILINMGKLSSSKLCKLAMDANCQIKMIMFSYRISSFYVEKYNCAASQFRNILLVAIEAFLWDEEFLLIIGMLDDARKREVAVMFW